MSAVLALLLSDEHVSASAWALVRIDPLVLVKIDPP
jgi:hypothetical protein